MAEGRLDCAGQVQRNEYVDVAAASQHGLGDLLIELLQRERTQTRQRKRRRRGAGVGVRQVGCIAARASASRAVIVMQPRLSAQSEVDVSGMPLQAERREQGSSSLFTAFFSSSRLASRRVTPSPAVPPSGIHPWGAARTSD